MKVQLIGLLLALGMLASCKDDASAMIEEGTYTGIFNVYYDGEVSSAQTTVTLTSNRYSCDGNPNRIPAGGSGTYSVEDNVITFNDENFWTAEFDWGLILNGAYTYSFDGTDLILRREVENVTYEYVLEQE